MVVRVKTRRREFTLTTILPGLRRIHKIMTYFVQTRKAREQQYLWIAPADLQKSTRLFSLALALIGVQIRHNMVSCYEILRNCTITRLHSCKYIGHPNLRARDCA